MYGRPKAMQVFYIKRDVSCFSKSNSLKTQSFRKKFKKQRARVIFLRKKKTAIISLNQPKTFLCYNLVSLEIFKHCLAVTLVNVQRNIGKSFQLAITTSRLNLIDYGDATTQSLSNKNIFL